MYAARALCSRYHSARFGAAVDVQGNIWRQFGFRLGVKADHLGLFLFFRRKGRRSKHEGVVDLHVIPSIMN